jgi:virginiamycin A acetyltransferase
VSTTVYQGIKEITGGEQNLIEVHPTARISHLADIEASTRGTRIVIGAHSVLDSFVKIKPAGGAGNVVLGARVTINSGCVIYTGNGLEIGDDVSIAANCVFAPVNHEYKDKSRKIRDQRFQPSRGGIIIEDDVWIGASCVVLDGTKIEKGCVIGAMSLVRGTLPAWSVSAGNPLRIIGWRK